MRIAHHIIGLGLTATVMIAVAAIATPLGGGVATLLALLAAWVTKVLWNSRSASPRPPRAAY